jgi:thioredoxin
MIKLKKDHLYIFLASAAIIITLMIASYRQHVPLVPPAEQGPEQPITSDVLTQPLKDHRFVIVDFFAQWCPACKNSLPLFQKFAQELKDNVFCMLIDIDEYPDLATLYTIEYLPTFIFFKEGKPIERITGFKKEVFKEKINELFK